MHRSVIVIGCILLAALMLAAATGSALPPPPNVRITYVPQLNNEEQVFICPTDSNIIIANWRDFRLGYRQIGLGRSDDGGQTWVDSLISSDIQYFGTSSWQSDPTLAVDRMGNFYISVLDFLPSGGPSSSVIAFYKSTDKGLSWAGPYIPPRPPGTTFEDKQYITVDRTGGPHDGNLYCAWARFYEGPNRIMFVRSTDGGLTFGDSVYIRPPQSSAACGYTGLDGGQFAIPIVSADGAVHVFWMGYFIDSVNDCGIYNYINQRTSTDGGATFQTQKSLVPTSGYMSANGGINTYGAPTGDADISGGPHSGNMYIVYPYIGPEDIGNSDIDLIRSTDNGQTWSARMQVNDDSNTVAIDNFHPWLIVNEDGVVIVVFYDQRFDVPNYLKFDLLAAYSYDGGLTFTANQRISTVSSSPSSLKVPPEFDTASVVEPFAAPMALMNPLAGKIGEYIGVTAFHDKVNAVWTDARDGNQEVYAANWYLAPVEPRLIEPASGLVVAQRSPTDTMPLLHWATSWKEAEDTYRIEVWTGGNEANPFVFWSDSNFLDEWTPTPPILINWGAGIYYWRVKTFTSDLSDSSGYSPTWQFVLDNQAPSPPQLAQPAYSAWVIDATPKFIWEASIDNPVGPISYELWVSDDVGFSPSASTRTYSGLTSLSYDVPDPVFEIPPYYFWYWKVVARDQVGNSSESEVWTFRYKPSCCIGTRGNINMSGIIDLIDLSLLIAYLTTIPAPTLPCLDAANVNGTGIIDLADLSLLIAYLVATPKPTLPPCP